ncbi:MAG TPA: type VI secretion system baseplate subunit TssK, partial [Acidobacteriota bacterium]|nr:type VI secretion system baseplate subunit TssK [Acidobacteriota bacterium]
MGYTRKLVWAEGMRITPHHFQQWDHHVDDQLTARIQALIHYGWGMSEIGINREAIANGHIVIDRLTGLLPDGMWFHLPESEPCPPARNFKEMFPPTESQLDVYLAIPRRQPGSRNFQMNGQMSNPPVRFRQVVGTVVDETRGEGELQLGQALGNYQILVGPEIREGFSALKIGVITRSATG